MASSEGNSSDVHRLEQAQKHSVRGTCLVHTIYRTQCNMAVTTTRGSGIAASSSVMLWHAYWPVVRRGRTTAIEKGGSLGKRGKRDLMTRTLLEQVVDGDFLVTFWRRLPQWYVSRFARLTEGGSEKLAVGRCKGSFHPPVPADSMNFSGG